MRPTRRWWLLVAVGTALLAWGLLLARWAPIAGAIGLAAWLLAHQFRFALLLDDTLGGLTVDQTVDRTRVSAGASTAVSIAVAARRPSPVSLAVATAPPAGAETTAGSVTLSRGDASGREDFTATWPVAGRFEFDTPTVTATDPAGLFVQRVARGSTPTITVEPRGPRNIHVGEGGDPVTAGFGEHTTGGVGSGLEPAEVRAYVPGDRARRIDWKATARLNQPHVREFEAETDRETVLIVDHRRPLAVGPPGERAFDYLRQVALAFVDSAERLGDPLACLSVGEAGLTGTFDPGASPDHLATVRRHLHGIDPPADEPGENDATTPGRRSPSEVRQAAARLTDAAPFATGLRPFLDRPGAVLTPVDEEPLLAAVDTARTRFRGRPWTVILTDDTDRAAVREAVGRARRGDRHVTVFLAPAVLYAVGELAALDEAYDRYRSFEGFRRHLAAIERVRAFEVGPADRLASVLASGRRARQQERGGA